MAYLLKNLLQSTNWYPTKLSKFLPQLGRVASCSVVNGANIVRFCLEAQPDGGEQLWGADEMSKDLNIYSSIIGNIVF